MSYKSIFQDVRSAVDWVHLNVSLLLYFTFHCGGLRKKRSKIFCQICYQYFDFHNEVLFEIWMEVKCCQNQTNTVPDLECSSQNIYWHVASCLYICGNVKKKRRKKGKIQGEVSTTFLAEVHILLLPVGTSTSNTAASFGLGHLLLPTAFLQTFVNKEQVAPTDIHVT